MPTKNDFAPVWTLVWKINQGLFPLVFAWGIWVTKEIFDAKAHSALSHAESPVELVQMTEIEKSLIRLESGIGHIKSDMADIKAKVETVR